MTKQQYQNYLKTDHWQRTKEKIKDRQSRCQLCGTTTYLDVHHKTYARLGRERLSDLIVLCRECHYDVHDGLQSLPREIPLVVVWVRSFIMKVRTRIIGEVQVTQEDVLRAYRALMKTRDFRTASVFSRLNAYLRKAEKDEEVALKRVI